MNQLASESTVSAFVIEFVVVIQTVRDVVVPLVPVSIIAIISSQVAVVLVTL